MIKEIKHNIYSSTVNTRTSNRGINVNILFIRGYLYNFALNVSEIHILIFSILFYFLLKIFAKALPT